LTAEKEAEEEAGGEEGQSAVAKGLEEEAVISELADVKDFDALYGALEKIKGIKGKKKHYAPQELREIIEQVRGKNGKQLSLDYVPRAGGLQKRVRELMGIDKARDRVRKVGMSLEESRKHQPSIESGPRW
jgi:hypothetical protein